MAAAFAPSVTATDAALASSSSDPPGDRGVSDVTWPSDGRKLLTASRVWYRITQLSDTCVKQYREARAYRRDTERLRDFARLMLVRVSEGRLGTFMPRRTVEVSFNSLGRNARLRTHTTDLAVYREIIWAHSLDPLPADPSAAVVLDLGANTGLSYRWLARRYPNARFVCVEPDPSNVELLRANVDPTRCIVVPACVGASERTTSLHKGAGEWGYRMTDQAGNVPVITMRKLLDQHGIDQVDVLKCDIEGAGREVFRDCGAWISRVRLMIVECHLDELNVDELCRLLRANDVSCGVTHLEDSMANGFELATISLS